MDKSSIQHIVIYLINEDFVCFELASKYKLKMSFSMSHKIHTLWMLSPFPNTVVGPGVQLVIQLMECFAPI